MISEFIKKHQKIIEDRKNEKLTDLNELKKKHQQDDNDEIYKTPCLSHEIGSEYKFDYIGSKVLHNENNLRRRLALESVYIHNERSNACNFKADTKFLIYNTKHFFIHGQHTWSFSMYGPGM